MTDRLFQSALVFCSYGFTSAIVIPLVFLVSIMVVVGDNITSPNVMIHIIGKFSRLVYYLSQVDFIVSKNYVILVVPNSMQLLHHSCHALFLCYKQTTYYVT